MDKIEYNKVILSGKIISNFEFSHESYGEKYYTAQLSIKRLSGQKDTIVMMASERIIDVKTDWRKKVVKILGQFRSYNRYEKNRNKLILSVFVKKVEIMTDFLSAEDENGIFLDGYICKPPFYRETPLGREIADILMAVNRAYGKSDYIPCIVWGKNARFAEGLEMGTRLKIWGRIQSREYLKKEIHDDGVHDAEKRTAYETSVIRLEVVQETEERRQEKFCQ